MTTSVYPTFPAAGRPMECMGLQGPYILIAAILLLADLLLFILLYCCGVQPWVCVLLVFGLGAGGLTAIAAFSKHFGLHGLTKHLASRRLPQGIRFDSRQVFFSLQKKEL